eukprot:371184_1
MMAVETDLVRTISWIVILFVIICVTLILLLTIYGLLSAHYHKGRSINNFQAYGDGYSVLEMTWCLSHVFTYLVYINRLDEVFKASAINSSQLQYKIFYLLIILFFLCELSVTILDFISNKISENVYFWSLLILYVIDICIDLIITTSIVYLFAKKLLTVIVHFTEMKIFHNKDGNISPYNINYKDNDKASEISEESEILNISQQKLLSVVIKHTTLSIIGIVSTQLYIVWGVIFSIISVSPTIHNDSYIQLIAYLINGYFLLNDCLMNCLSISLNFAFASNIYNKLCCICHIGFKKCCLKLAKKK